MKIFIGCSSRKTNFDTFQIEASELATHLANAGYDLVIGGLVDGGMMGRVYQAFLDAKRGITVHTLKEYQEEVNDKKYTKVSIIERRLKGHFICTEMPIPYYFYRVVLDLSVNFLRC